MIDSSVNFHTKFQEFSDTLDSPIGLECLTEAVFLFPCGHKLNEPEAISYFGDMVEGKCTKLGKRCTVCTTTITSWHIDHTIRALAKLFRELKPTILSDFPASKSSAEKKEDAEMKEAAAVGKDDLPPFPGKSAKFNVLTDWGIFETGAGLCRFLKFKTDDKDSLISEFHFAGYKDKSIKILLIFNTSFHSIEWPSKTRFLTTYNFEINALNLYSNSFLTETIEQTKKVFAIFTKYNEIPVDSLKLIAPIVEKGSWS
jgi:hypothetical protein